MIKNSFPALEDILATGVAPASAVLTEYLDSVGLQYMAENNRVRLVEALEILDPERIHASIDGVSTQSFELEIYRQIDSTNNQVMSTLREPQTLVCLAEMQSAGKGRRGRKWLSPFGKNIYLSIGCHLHRDITELGGLSLVVGMQVVEVLRSFGLNEAGLKWPNDVLLGAGKLGGILVELQPPGKSSVGVVIGVGLNLSIDSNTAAAIDQPWSDTGEGLNVSRNELAGSLAGKIMQAATMFDAEGFDPFVRIWNDYNLYAGQQVRVIRGDKVFVGVDRGVDESGNLLLETPGGIDAHNAGEVSLRPLFT